ncbi:MAG: aminoglycoside phosphotransferase family protein [Chthoniobacterales bacterium]
MKTEILLRQTRIHFPRIDIDSVKITPIEKGGSGRKFYRVHHASEQKLILVKYNLERKENGHYVGIAQFLDAHGIRAPKIYFHDPNEGLIWIEDLGEEDLFNHRNEGWLVRRALYESALDQGAKLHRIEDKDSKEIRTKLPAQFNAQLYRWEQSYFFKNCLGRYFRMDQIRLRELAALPALREMAETLAALPRVLVHRDFQSQNIIIRNGLAYLIDFQGMRPGLAEYDVASLLYDPYVRLTEEERAELVAYYIERQMECGRDVRRQFTDAFPMCAIQRLMQALGAYGYLGLVKKHEHFLQHIPSALKSLSGILNGRPELAAVAAAVAEALNGAQK